ncbi:zinc-ribbon domain containing protein [Lysobacter gummosus]|uniref:Zinc-ribbon domain containing protein n=1 Tax=Lysobacter gummosus TaxID=262324 RepID=A0ABY3XAT8_9GAMM|nr:zinc-ribbon domain containing protein [Lysobacter gummosus]UNP29674.1 zinc-ribbon domain containing protein [Lysobacter gummosus]
MAGRNAKIAVDMRNWSDESRRSMAAEFAGPVYVDQALSCRRCDREFVFSAQRQKEIFEVRKAYIWQRPVLCPQCWPLRLQWVTELKSLRARWSSQRAVMKRDVEALWRWRRVLDELTACGLRRDKAQIAMLDKLLIRAAADSDDSGLTKSSV